MQFLERTRLRACAAARQSRHNAARPSFFSCSPASPTRPRHAPRDHSSKWTSPVALRITSDIRGSPKAADQRLLITCRAIGGANAETSNIKSANGRIDLTRSRSLRPLGLTHLCRSHPSGSIRRGEHRRPGGLLLPSYLIRLSAFSLNGADGISDIEGKATRVGASERGKRTSFNPSSVSGSPGSATATICRLQTKEPHDGTHHAALKMASISYTRPSVASVGSSIADVIANPLSAW